MRGSLFRKSRGTRNGLRKQVTEGKEGALEPRREKGEGNHGVMEVGVGRVGGGKRRGKGKSQMLPKSRGGNASFPLVGILGEFQGRILKY